MPQARDEVLERMAECFPPELLNRPDPMLVSNKLLRESILQVVDIQKMLRDTIDVDEWIGAT